MKLNKNYIFPFLATSLWGSMYAASKIVLQTVPPITVLVFRYVIACIALAFMAKKTRCIRKVEKGDWLPIFAIGFVAYFLANICQLCGTARVGASMASLINALNPVTMPIAAALLLHEPLTKRRMAAVGVALAGVYIILGPNSSEIKLDYIGVALSFGCVLFFTLGSLIMRKIAGKYNAIQVTLYGMIIALIFNIPTSLWELQSNPISFRPITIICLIYMGTFGTAVSHAFWNRGLKLLDTGTCSMFYPMQPVVTVIIASLFLNEPLTKSFAIGSVLIISAIFLGLGGPKADSRDSSKAVR